MMKKTYESIDKKGRQTNWEWEETPELVKALEALNESSKLAASLQQGGQKKT
tara:strand:- start:129 stop:284 length:156 start_codon:yes stop_codon:yes gene_type:complete